MTTQERNNTIVAMYNQGYKYKAIAEVVNIEVNHVSAMVGRLRSQGLLNGSRYGSTDLQPKSVQQRCSEGYDFKFEAFHRSQARHDELVDLYFTSLPTDQISARFGVSNSVIRMAWYKLKQKGRIPKGLHRNSWVQKKNSKSNQ